MSLAQRGNFCCAPVALALLDLQLSSKRLIDRGLHIFCAILFLFSFSGAHSGYKNVPNIPKMSGKQRYHLESLPCGSQASELWL